MNYALIRYLLGWVLIFESCFLTLPCITAVIYQEREGFAFLAVLALCLVLGMLLTARRPKRDTFYTKEGFVVVTLAWVLLSAMGALPFVFNGDIPSFTDALFETISGFTTTGASILSDVEALSRCSLFWRSFTHWIGGMGVIVFILAVLPMTGGSTMSLMRAESPGPSVGKLVPKIRQTAMLLYKIYFFMTVVEIIILIAGGMPVFDALTTSFGTAGTGGFGIKNNSMAGYSDFLINTVTVFMILFGVNFNVYYLIYAKKFRKAAACEEMHGYFLIIAAAIGVITINIRGMFGSPLQALKHAAFQVGSIITTTGYSTTDFDMWPQLSRTILVVLMFIGACAGSTGGGIKVSRILVLVKTVKKELDSFVHPRLVKKIHLEGRPIEHETLRSINVFTISYLVIFAASVLVIALDEFDLVTNFTAVAATFNNIGPGLSKVGPTMNFGSFSVLSKYVLMFDMLAGRLELFPVLLCLYPSTWKKF